MNDRSVRIAICIKDRVARQLACSMFSSAGAEVQVCEDPAGVKAAADAGDLQAVVLGLGAAPEATFDALVLLRQWFAAMPIYVIADAAGQRHSKRTKAFGATQVIPHEELQRRVGQLIRAVAQTETDRKDDWEVRAPGWAPGKADDGYDVQSMDLGAWLSIPGNRRLLGLKEPEAPTSDAAPQAERTSGPVSAQPSSSSSSSSSYSYPSPAPSSPAPAITARTWTAAPVVPAEPPPLASFAAAPAPAAPPPAAVAPPPMSPVAGSGPNPCGLSDCSLLSICRVEHDARTAAILDAQKQRERRAQEQQQAARARMLAELQTELRDAITASETRMQEELDERVRLGVAAGVAVLNRMVGVLVVVLALLCAGLVWKLGPW